MPQAFLAILVNILGFYVTSYIMGQVYSIILNLDVANNHFISTMQDAENWFKLRQFPLDMREQINRYLVRPKPIEILSVSCFLGLLLSQ